MLNYSVAELRIYYFPNHIAESVFDLTNMHYLCKNAKIGDTRHNQINLFLPSFALSLQKCENRRHSA